MAFRLIFNACLAAFTGLVLIKINEPAQIYDLESSFNGRAMLFHGSAPDQYRILPFALMRAIYEAMKSVLPGISLNAALQVFNVFSAFLLFEINHFILKKHTDWQPRNLLLFNGLFAIGHAYTQILYWKPDALFTIAICLLAINFFLIKNRPGSFLAIIILSFCRADVALFYALFYSIYIERDNRFTGIITRLAIVSIPIAVQLFIQKILFPETRYFCDVFQLKENFKVYRIFIMPFTWLLICIMMLFGKQVLFFFKNNWQHWRIAFLLMVGYFCLIACVARVSEYRLYLPMLPVVLFVYLKNLKPA